MNRWVVICKCESFPFSASTPFPARRVFLLWQLHLFVSKSLLLTPLAKSRWSPAHGVQVLV